MRNSFATSMAMSRVQSTPASVPLVPQVPTSTGMFALCASAIRILQEPARALVDETVARLERAIVTGELSQGQKLSEQALSARFGISRGPLREAVRTLEGRRLVERTPFSGVRVVRLSVDDIEQ